MFTIRTKYLAGLYFLLIGIVSQGIGQIAFEEVGAANQVNHQLGNPTIGSGVSIFDFNQDGLDDLTMGTYRDRQIGFYINTGSGFEKIPPLVNNTEIVKQINWVDFDNDGDPDLYVAANDGINRLYRNDGNLEMEDITVASGLPENIHYGYGAAWGDYNRDGWLDLYYASKGVIGNPDVIRSYNRLFKNNADGSFTELTEEANVADDGKLPFCAAFLDYNNDMWPDIYIANDKLTFNTLLENDGKGSFLDVSAETGANAKMNAMCVNPGDIDRDGWMDIYVTNTPVGSQCLRNSGVVNEDGYLQYNDIAMNLGIHFEGGNCWGSNFLDADNDGDLDLYVSSSIPTPKDKSSAFYENIDGAYFDFPVIDGFLKDTSASYSNAIGDFNNDGWIDIVVQNNPPHDFFLWENQTDNLNHWLKINLEGVLSNRDGVGSRIESYVGDVYQMQFTLCGSGFLGQNSSFKHIGLGTNDLVDSLVITWPSGHIDKLYNVGSDQVIKITEGSSTNGQIDVSDDVRIVERAITTATDDIEPTDILIFPNPGVQGFSIESESPIQRIEIYNSNGQIIEKRDLNRSSFPVDTENLDPGLYFIKVSLKEKEIQVLKWLKI